MPILIVNSIARYSILGLLAGVPTATIFDAQIDTTGSDTDRDAAVADYAEVLFGAWSDRLRPVQVDEWVMTEIRWVDLNAVDGSVGSFVGTQTGGNSGSSTMPGNVTALIRKVVGHARNTRQGRMFFPGIPEDYTAPNDPNVLTDSVVAGLQDSFDDFFGQVNGDMTGGGGIGGYQAHPAVVHAPKDHPTSFDLVQSFGVLKHLGQQTRRRGY